MADPATAHGRTPGERNRNAEHHQTILHISDIHATRNRPLYGRVDGLLRLHRIAAYAAAAGLTPEAIVVTGDLAQAGHPEVYPAVDAELRKLSAQLAAPVFVALGNHDDPDAARAMTGHALAHHRCGLTERLRIITLDSSSGSLPAGQLDWLRRQLRRPYEWGTVLALHHPPVPSPLPALSQRGLANTSDLLAALAGSDVRLVMAGHYHHAMSGSFSGHPLWVGPSLAYQQIMNAGPDVVSGEDSAMFSIVQITSHGLSAAPVSIEASTPLFTVPAHLSTSIP